MSSRQECEMASVWKVVESSVTLFRGVGSVMASVRSSTLMRRFDVLQ